VRPCKPICRLANPQNPRNIDMPNEEQIENLRKSIANERKAVRNSLGIDEDFRVVRFVFNEPSGILVTSVERLSVEDFERRLFFRHTSETKYRQVGDPSPDIHYSDVITSLKQPVIYYRATRVAKSCTPGEFGGDWLSVERFDLREYKSASIITKNGLIFPEPYTSGWGFQLHGVSPNDATLFCTCGLHQPKESKVHHWFCGVDVGTKKVSLISRMEGIWF